MSLHKIIEISLTGITEILKAEIWSNLQDEQINTDFFSNQTTTYFTFDFVCKENLAKL